MKKFVILLLILAGCQATPQFSEGVDPDIWTKHPEIVRNVLVKAGFECGVKPTILPERDGIIRKPEWTCRYTWEDGYAEFYIHKIEE